ncbi:hypothetical protein KOR42_06450 [Thalassoglobus neptunius]|uniref:Uncharacterized protein n=1 Tax=Thalassoglobus neptunius TaxID=1938619 RepID=A0A5C5X2W0_9PLAN|nr:hypothetical protein KOR42_06450 [Thalassoglobus neptunius]
MQAAHRRLVIRGRSNAVVGDSSCSSLLNMQRLSGAMVAQVVGEQRKRKDF